MDTPISNLYSTYDSPNLGSLTIVSGVDGHGQDISLSYYGEDKLIEPTEDP